jgi:hypothetical protein
VRRGYHAALPQRRRHRKYHTGRLHRQRRDGDSQRCSEPEITDLCDYINACGGDIRIESDSTVRVRGVSALHGTVHRVIPDRIAAATYLCAAAITRGEIALHGVVPDNLTSMLPVLEEMGCDLRLYEDAVCLTCKQRPKAVRSVKNHAVPGLSHRRSGSRDGSDHGGRTGPACLWKIFLNPVTNTRVSFAAWAPA